MVEKYTNLCIFDHFKHFEGIENIKGIYFCDDRHDFSNCLSLPIYPELKRKEINYVCECLKKVLIETEKK